jgi:parvulin-like peptidyl-prolyl isomerase
MAFRLLCPLLIILSLCCQPICGADAASTVAATVNGRTISAEQLQWQFFLNQLPESASTEQRRQLLERLIDRELIRQFLSERKIVADEHLVEHQQEVIRQLISKRGETLSEVLGRLHLSEDQLRDYLALPIAWNAYVQSVLTESQVQAEWAAHQAEFDGTRVKGAQIVRTLPPTASEEDWQAATRVLESAREKILSGQMTFAQAAQALSQSPSGKNGGDLGEFEYRGRVDRTIAAAAFKLTPGEISLPFRSRRAVHLVQVQERIPGQLCLEDARPELIERISERLWEETAARQRAKSRIQIQIR